MSRLNFESIYWNGETKLINLTQEEFKDKVDSLEGYTRIPLTSSVDKYLFEKCYSVRKSYNNLILYMVDNGKFVRYGTNWLDSTKNETHGTGSKAISLVLDKFTEVTGSTFCKAFGTVEERFKRNVPKQFIYTNPKHLNKQKRLGSIDACSHYPANMRGRLPDAHTAIVVKGRVEPSEEYPFAFYKSGHCAEYQVFDTHNWLGHKYYCMNLFRYDFKKEDLDIYALGSKGYDALSRRGYNIKENRSDIMDDPTYEDAMKLCKVVLDSFANGEIGEIYLAYTHFKNTVTHIPTLVKLLPVDTEGMGEVEEDDNVMMNFEPSTEEALDLVIPKYVTSLFYGALVESVASENGARMQAMDSATSNADEIISDLTLKFNRARQGAITQELTEIIAGANAIN